MAEAKAELAKITATGGTNYGLRHRRRRIRLHPRRASSPPGRTSPTFLSDGQPNLGTEIGTTDETGWKSYLQTQPDHQLRAGHGASPRFSPTSTRSPTTGVTKTNLDGQVISDFNQLSSALQATVPTPASGEIPLRRPPGRHQRLRCRRRPHPVDHPRRRHLHLQRLRLGAASPSLAAPATAPSTRPTQQLTVTTAAGGTLVINMSSGSYTYTPIATVSTTIHDGFGFTLIDKDGDTAGSDGRFQHQPARPKTCSRPPPPPRRSPPQPRPHRRVLRLQRNHQQHQHPRPCG